MNRFLEPVRYNRNWARHILSRYRNFPDDELLKFELRNGQEISLTAGVRFTLNEIYLDKVYDVPDIDPSNLRHVLDLGANVGLFAT